MFSNHSRRKIGPGLQLPICLIGVVLLTFSLPAFGQQIHQLSYNGSTWTDQNLNGGLAEPWAVASFFTTPNDQLHVFYGAHISGDLHQLFYNGSSWADESLSQAAPVCNVNCGITGFSVGNFQYVYYVGGPNLDLHQVLYNNAEWVDTDLTVASGTDTLPVSNPIAFTTSPALHVYYLGAEPGSLIGHVHQLYATNGTNWQDQDLTAASGGPDACQVCISIAGFNVDNFQYVYYLDLANHIHQLSYNNVSWSDEDLTALTKSSPASSASTMSAFVIPGTKKMRVYFVSGANGHVMQFASTNNGKWTSSDLTKKAKGSVPDLQIAGYPDATGGKVNVYYAAGSHVNRIYQPSAKTWANEDLTALTNGGAADSADQFAGFSLNNNQYLYYVAD